MEDTSTVDYIVLLIGGSLAFFLLAGGIVFFVLAYKRKILKKDLFIIEKDASHQKELVEKNLNATENERKRVARELHDEVGSSLSMLRLMSSVEEFDELKIKGLIDKTIDNVRRISNDLLPSGLEEFGLEHGLEVLFESVKDSSNIKIEFHSQLSTKLESHQNLMIYRIVQELVNNSVKHSKAQWISTTILEENQHLEISYSDDGEGFDMETAKLKNSLGLKNIFVRAENLNGTVRMSSKPMEGFSAKINIPITHENNKNRHHR